MTAPTEVQRSFERSAAERTFHLAEQTVREFNEDIRALEASSSLTSDFLLYADNLTADIPDGKTVSIDVTQPYFEEKRSLKQRVFSVHATSSPRSSIERYYVRQRQYLGIFYRRRKNKSLELAEEIDQMSFADIEKGVAGLARRPSATPYIPPLYDQSRRPAEEIISDGSFVTYSTVSQDGLHLSIPRMDQIIETLEEALSTEQTDRVLHTTTGHDAYNATLDDLGKTATDIFDRYGQRMCADFGSILAAANKIRTELKLDVGKDISLRLYPHDRPFLLSTSNGILYESVLSPDTNKKVLQPVPPGDLPKIMPALLEYLRSYATL